MTKEGGIMYLEELILAQYPTKSKERTIGETLAAVQQIKGMNLLLYLRDGAGGIIETILTVLGFMKRNTSYKVIMSYFGTPFMSRVQAQSEFFLRESVSYTHLTLPTKA